MGGQMTMRGPTARLAGIAAFLGRASADLPSMVSRSVENEVMPLIQGGFNSRTDPYGESWPRPVAGNLPLQLSGKGRRSYEVIRVLSGSRWTIMASNNAQSKEGAWYMAILQHGFISRSGTRVEKRKQVPDAKRLSSRWTDRLRAGARRGAAEWRRSAP